MTIHIGYLKSESQFLKITVDNESNSVKDSVHDTVEIKDTHFNLFIINENVSEGLELVFEKEEMHYPIISEEAIGEKLESFIAKDAAQITNLFLKISKRWVLKNNMQLVETLVSQSNHLKTLFNGDRSAFFEELWFVFKQNTNANDLSIIFHDVKEPKDESKGDKATLIYSYVKGDKVPQIFEGTPAQEKIMEAYKNEFTEEFQITDFDSTSGKLVVCFKIGLSPILVMAKVSELNQIQVSLFKGLFNSLKA